MMTLMLPYQLARLTTVTPIGIHAFLYAMAILAGLAMGVALVVVRQDEAKLAEPDDCDLYY